VSEPRKKQDGRRAPARGAVVTDDVEKAQPLGVALELDVAEEHIDSVAQLDGIVKRSSGTRDSEVVGRRNGGRDSAQNRRMIVDDADAHDSVHRASVRVRTAPGLGAD
jgi:hypothetical protein